MPDLFRILRHAAVVLTAFGLLFLLTGCGAVPIAQQRLVSRPAMTFDESAAGHAAVNLAAQIEPGVATTGGAQNAGCTSCR